MDKVDVGTYNLIPPGYKLRTLRYFPGSDSFLPHGTVAINRSAKTWRVSGFAVGGKPGEERGIDIALAGRSASVFLDYWEEANKDVLRKLSEATGKVGPGLLAIRTWPDDLITCQRVFVKRSES